MPTAGEGVPSFASLLDGEAAADEPGEGPSYPGQHDADALEQFAVRPTTIPAIATLLTAPGAGTPVSEEACAEAPLSEDEEQPEDSDDSGAEETAPSAAVWMWFAPAAARPEPTNTVGPDTSEPTSEAESGEDTPCAETRDEPSTAGPERAPNRRRDPVENEPVIARKAELGAPAPASPQKAIVNDERGSQEHLDNRGLARAAEVARPSENSAVARYRDEQVPAEAEIDVVPWQPRAPGAREAWRNGEGVRLDRPTTARSGRQETDTLVVPAPRAAADFELPEVAVEPVLPPARIAGSAAAALPESPEILTGGPEKFSQIVTRDVVNPTLRALGIDPAKVTTTMEFVSPEGSTLGSDSLPGQPGAAFAAGAARTVERVLHTADLMRATDRSGVQLRLDFGESGPLSVQITLRQGRVHTLFRSDSPELRSTLAQAWDNFAQRGDIAVLPLAEPVLLPMRSNMSTNPSEGGRFSDSFTQADGDGRSGRESRAAREEARAAAGPLSRRRTSRSVTSSPARESAPGHLRVHA